MVYETQILDGQIYVRAYEPTKRGRLVKGTILVPISERTVKAAIEEALTALDAYPDTSQPIVGGST